MLLDVTPQQAAVLKRMIDRESAAEAGAQSRATSSPTRVYVQITSTTQTASRYPGTSYRVTDYGDDWEEIGDCWVKDVGGAALVTGRKYEARAAGYAGTPSYPVFLTDRDASTLVTVTKSQITSDQNDYDLTDNADIYRLSTDAERTVTGFSGGADGRKIIIHNTGTQNLLISHQSASSSAANRVANGQTLKLGLGHSAILQYDATSSRWRVIGDNYQQFLSLNGLTGATQTFATPGTTGSDINWVSSTTIHTLHVPNASTSARGVVTTSGQTFGGQKTFDDSVVVGGNTSHFYLGSGITGVAHARISLPSGELALTCYTNDDDQRAELRIVPENTGTGMPGRAILSSYDTSSGFLNPYYSVYNSSGTVKEGQWGTLPDGSEVSGGLITDINNLGAAKVQSLAADPGTPVNGDIWYNTTGNQLKAYVNGSTVVLA